MEVSAQAGPEDPRWLVEWCAEALGTRPDPVKAADALLGAPSGADPESTLRTLERVAEALGLRVEAFRGRLDEVLAHASPRLPVAAWRADGTICLLLGRVGDKVRVRTGPGPDGERLVDRRELEPSLGGRFAHLELALPFDPHVDHAHGPTPFARLWRLVVAEREDLAIVLVYAVGVGVLSLVMPIAAQTLVNTVVFGTFLQPIFWLSLLALGGLATGALLQLAQLRVVETLQRRVFVRLVAELGHRLPRVRTDALDQQDAAILVNRFFDVLTLQKSLSTLVLDGVGVLVSGLAGTLLLALYSPWFLFYAAVLWAALVGLLLVTGRRAPETSIEESYAKHEVAAWIEQIASNPSIFKHGGVSEWAAVRADALSRKYLGARDAHFRIWFRQVAALLLLSAGASTTLLGLGGWLVVGGSLSVGQLLAAELVVTVVLGSFAKLGKQLESLYDLLAALDKIGHLLDLPLERAGGAALPPGTGPLTLEVESLAWSVPDGRRLFEQASFSLRPGERVALTGPPGSGRGTLLDLVVGARTPAEGVVRVGGMDLREVRLEDLRRRAVLVRGVELVAGSVAENVRAGRRQVSDSDVRVVLARVGLLDAVAALPDGLRTTLGPSGEPLSGTQARLLVLARALVGSPGLLLIDELVDALSPEARAPMLDLLLGERRDLTVVLVTRDPAIVARCDRVVRFTRGPGPFTSRLEIDAGGAPWVR